MLARWPGHIPPGDSDALVCHVDMLATMAALTGQTLPAEAGPDSFNVLPALLGQGPGRDHLVEHGNVLALREGTWKYIATPQGMKGQRHGLRDAELYNLADDIGETHNVAADQPDRVLQMAGHLTRIREEGRSRP
jgi:arylsulfatase A-like enzyme